VLDKKAKKNLEKSVEEITFATPVKKMKSEWGKGVNIF
jgi:hypothetical protein